MIFVSCICHTSGKNACWGGFSFDSSSKIKPKELFGDGREHKRAAVWAAGASS